MDQIRVPLDNVIQVIKDLVTCNVNFVDAGEPVNTRKK